MRAHAPKPIQRRAAPRKSVAGLGLGLLLTLGSCASIPSYEEKVRSLPADDFIEIDGVTVHIETAGNPDSMSPVILVHGFGASSYSWRKVAPELASHHRVVAVDLVGFGLTERPQERSHYTRSGQVRVLSGIVDHFGWDSAHFVGHSYGGGLIMSLAHLEPHKVRSLVLVGSTAPNYSDLRRHFFGRQPFATFFARLFLRPYFVERSLERSFFDDQLATNELIDAYLERIRVEGAGRAFAGLTAPAEPDPRFANLTYPSLEQPTLAIWGSHDPLIPAEGARKSIATMPDSRFVEIEECGHLPMEEKPAQMLAELLPFLDQVDSDFQGKISRVSR